jgi:hypothetical protein
LRARRNATVSGEVDRNPHFGSVAWIVQNTGGCQRGETDWRLSDWSCARQISVHKCGRCHHLLVGDGWSVCNSDRASGSSVTCRSGWSCKSCGSSSARVRCSTWSACRSSESGWSSRTCCAGVRRGSVVTCCAGRTCRSRHSGCACVRRSACRASRSGRSGRT